MGAAKHHIFLDNFCLKQSLVLRKLKNDIEIAPKPSGIEL